MIALAKNESMPAETPLDLVKAAKCVVALSGWTKTPEGREVYQSSYFAMEVLRKAIEEHENPVLRLAPEPIHLDSPAMREARKETL